MFIQKKNREHNQNTYIFVDHSSKSNIIQQEGVKLNRKKLSFDDIIIIQLLASLYY